MISREFVLQSIVENSKGPRGVFAPADSADDSYLELKVEDTHALVEGRSYLQVLIEVPVDASPEEVEAAIAKANELSAERAVEAPAPAAEAEAEPTTPAEPKTPAEPAVEPAAEPTSIEEVNDKLAALSREQLEDLCEDQDIVVTEEDNDETLAATLAQAFVEEAFEIPEPAPEPEPAKLTPEDVEKLDVDGLRAELKARNLSTKGGRADLEPRLLSAIG